MTIKLKFLMFITLICLSTNTQSMDNSLAAPHNHTIQTTLQHPPDIIARLAQLTESLEPDVTSCCTGLSCGTAGVGATILLLGGNISIGVAALYLGIIGTLGCALRRAKLANLLH